MSPTSLRRLSIAAVAFTAITAASAPAAAQPGRVIVDSPLLNQPRFAATAVKIRVLDETGVDRLGNDEVGLVMSDFTHFAVARFFNADAGETFAVPAASQCIQPMPTCAGGVASLRFRVALWENDTSPLPGTNFCYGAIGAGDYLFQNGLCSGDDLIGRAEVTHPHEELVAALPNVGDSKEFTIKPTGGAGSYRFTYRVTRLANAEGPIVVDPGRDPGTPAITLQATVNSSPLIKRVTLTWSGATTSTVDIYRNAAKLVTTANDGNHEDQMLAAGTYRYRLCNLGSTTACSAEVMAVVP